MKGEAKWLEARMKGIGGSDISAIIGLNPWKSNVDVWEEKVLGKTSPISNMAAVNYGKKAEKHLIELFKLDFPQYKVFAVGQTIRKHPEYDFIIGTLDGELTEKESGRKGVLEIKTTEILNSMHREKWKDKVPDSYFCQVCWYLLVTGFDFAVLKAQLKSVMNDGEIYCQTKHYHIERNEVEEDIDLLKREALIFWNDYVVPKKMPPLRLPAI